MTEAKEHTSSCHLEPDSFEDTKEHASERSPERKRENPQSPSPDRKHENHPFIIQKSSSTGATSAVLLVYLWYFLFKPDSNFLIMTPNIFDLYMPKLSNYAKIPVFNFLMFVIKQLPKRLRQEETKEHASSCHLEPDSLTEAKELASVDSSSTNHLEISTSPERKCENEQSPSPERKCENEQSPSGKRKASSCFFIPGTRIKFVINRKKHFYCYLENTGNGNRIIGLSAGTKRDIAEILNSLPAPEPPIAQQYNTVSLSTFFPKESGKKTSTPPTSSQPPYFTSILLDDHAFHSHADHHYLQLSRLTSSIISVSSPNGEGNLFHELSDRAKKEDLFILHWIHNPLYDRAWYDTLIQTASAGFVEQFINQQFAYRYKNNHKRPSPPLTPNNPIAEQYVKVSLSTFFSKESEKKTSMKPANTKTPQKKTSMKPANTKTPQKKTTIKPANTKTPQEKAAFKHDTPTSATAKPKRPPIISALTGSVRDRFKALTATASSSYYNAKGLIVKTGRQCLTLPNMSTKNYKPVSLIKGWRGLNHIIANRANLFIESKKQALDIIIQHSEKTIPGFIIPPDPQDKTGSIQYPELFYNEPSVQLLYRVLSANRPSTWLDPAVHEERRRQLWEYLSAHHERRKKHRQPAPDMMESELINDLAGLPSNFTIDQLVYIRFLLRDYSILKAEKRNRMAREDRERYPAIYEAMQKPRPKRDKYYPSSINWDVIFPDGYRSDRYPDIDYTPPQHEFKPSKENEEEWSRSRVIHELWEKKFMREDGRLYPRTIDWDVTFTKPTESCHLEPVNQTEAKKHASERSPDRKQENPESPSHERKHKNKQQPSNSGHRACPDSIGEPANQSESCHLEPDSPEETKEHASGDSSSTNHLEISTSPDRKHKNKQSPPPLPQNINERPNCPPEIEYCPLGSDHHIPCYPECPRGMIHNYNRYMREEEAKRIQQKEKSKKKTNKTKNARKNKGRPPP